MTHRTSLSIGMRPAEVYVGWAFFLFQQLALPPLLTLIFSALPWQISAGQLNLLYSGISFVCVIAIFHQFL